MIELFSIIIFISIIHLIKLFISKNFTTFKSESYNNYNYPTYIKKQLLTYPEKKFYNTLLNLQPKYIIIPQVCLASVIEKKIKTKYNNDLFKIIDFAIFNQDLNELLLLIELNDQSHNDPKRIDRDLKVKKICNDSQITLMTFYTHYPNEQNYVINRILKEIEKDSCL